MSTPVGETETPWNEQSFAVYDELSAQINAQLQKLSQIMKTMCRRSINW